MRSADVQGAGVGNELALEDGFVTSTANAATITTHAKRRSHLIHGSTPHRGQREELPLQQVDEQHARRELPSLFLDRLGRYVIERAPEDEDLKEHGKGVGRDVIA